MAEGERLIEALRDLPSTRQPRVGDAAVVIEFHQAGHAFEVECSDPANGETIWLDAMYIDELATPGP